MPLNKIDDAPGRGVQLHGVDTSQCAAAYVRTSDKHQLYCTGNQLDRIRAYASQHGLEIVKIFCDEGRSGLTLQGRPALSQLIAEVLAGTTAYSHILIMDVTRWGRFIDNDESAHYEFLCRKAGIRVHYCAEQFPNDGSLQSIVAKTLKRAMAGEYSRELSAKVYRASVRHARNGFLVGGIAIFGLRRMLVDQDRRPKTILLPGQRKNVDTDKVVLVPGPQTEIDVVLTVFKYFAQERLTPLEIAGRLNRLRLPSPSGKPWTNQVVGALLRNERYIGNLVYAKRTQKLGGRLVPTPPETWIRSENAFPAIVPRELFFKAQERLKNDEMHNDYTEAELLERIVALWKKEGHLSRALIDASEQTPWSRTYRMRFGSMEAVYRLIGFRMYKSFHGLDPRVLQLREDLARAIVRKLQSVGNTAVWFLRGTGGQMIINGRLRVRIHLVRHERLPSGASSWRIHHKVKSRLDFTLAARLACDNQSIKDFYLLPHTHGNWHEAQLTDGNDLDVFRCNTLDGLVTLAAQSKGTESA